MRTLPLILLLTLTAATTKPSTTQSNDSAPRAALLMYDKLVGPNQSDKALALYHATATREKAVAHLLATLDGRLAALVDAATKKWDKQTAESLARTAGSKTAADINAAEIKVTGDTAIVRFPGDEDPVLMTNVNGEWKISVKHLVQQVAKDIPLDRFRKSLATLTTSIEKITASIAGGQLTPDTAKTQLEQARKSAFAAPE
jgi:hypothetical protein